MTATSRDQLVTDWVAQRFPNQNVQITPASADASFRRYFRLPLADGALIAVDAPPEKENSRPFVAIARALLADSSLLLLDDALSAVDTGTETRILEHLGELRAARPERAAIIASHRLSAVAGADHIVVLREGRVTESGSHDELLALNGWYASQWRYQQLEASIDAE